MVLEASRPRWVPTNVVRTTPGLWSEGAAVEWAAAACVREAGGRRQLVLQCEGGWAVGRERKSEEGEKGG